MADGQLIRLVGRGGTRPGGRPADLYLVVHLAPDPRYRVQGRDLVVRLPVAPWEAALGGSLEVTTPAGSVRLRVPPGSWSGRRLRVPGLGFRDPGGRLGDMVAVIEVVVPRHVSDVERALYHQLAAKSAFEPCGCRLRQRDERPHGDTLDDVAVRKATA